jgi:hypothetical protein
MIKIVMQSRKKISRLKQVFTFFLVFFTLISFHGIAQITIDQSDMPGSGDTIRKSTALNMNQYDFDQTGEGITWDFSELQPISQTVDTFIKVTETPIFYWPFFLTISNLASPVGNSPFEQLPLNEVYNFFKNSSADFRDVGFAATIFGIPLPFKFDNPDILYDFPVDYGNTDSSHSGFQFSIPDIGFIMVDRNRTNTVDGWGNLITPYGTFEVLRLRSEVQEYDSLYLDSLNLGIPVNLVYTEYKWLAKGQKIPLLKVTENMLGQVIEYVDTIRDISLGIDEEISHGSRVFNIYPNPAREWINIELSSNITGNIEFTIYNLEGRVIAQFRKNKQSIADPFFKIDLKNLGLKPGDYILKYDSEHQKGSKQFIYSP